MLHTNCLQSVHFVIRSLEMLGGIHYKSALHDSYPKRQYSVSIVLGLCIIANRTKPVVSSTILKIITYIATVDG